MLKNLKCIIWGDMFGEFSLWFSTNFIHWRRKKILKPCFSTIWITLVFGIFFMFATNFIQWLRKKILKPWIIVVFSFYRGSFEILDTDSPGEFYDEFQAHPPGKVSRKAYEFSKQMPGVLQFKLQHRCDVWEEIFHTYTPVGNDIALFFFPGDFERFDLLLP